jgi:hypothetical protein
MKSYILNKRQQQESIGQPLNSRFLKEGREEVQRNIAILKRVVDVSKVLAKQNLALLDQTITTLFINWKIQALTMEISWKWLIFLENTTSFLASI